METRLVVLWLINKKSSTREYYNVNADFRQIIN